MNQMYIVYLEGGNATNQTGIRKAPSLHKICSQVLYQLRSHFHHFLLGNGLHS